MRPTTIERNGDRNALQVRWGNDLRAIVAGLLLAVIGQGLLLWRSAAVAESRLSRVEEMMADHLAWSRQEVPQLVTQAEWRRATETRDKQIEALREELRREFDLVAAGQRKTLDRVAYVQGTVDKLPAQPEAH